MFGGDATSPAAPRTIQGDREPDPGTEVRGLCKIFLMTSANCCPGPGILEPPPAGLRADGRNHGIRTGAGSVSSDLGSTSPANVVSLGSTRATEACFIHADCSVPLTIGTTVARWAIESASHAIRSPCCPGRGDRLGHHPSPPSRISTHRISSIALSGGPADRAVLRMAHDPQTMLL